MTSGGRNYTKATQKYFPKMTEILRGTPGMPTAEDTLNLSFASSRAHTPFDAETVGMNFGGNFSYFSSFFRVCILWWEIRGRVLASVDR